MTVAFIFSKGMMEMTMTDWIKKNASTILTCVSAVGMVGTVVLAVRATPKAMRACTDAQVEKGRTQLTKLEVAKAAAPAYLPTIAAGTGTLLCLFGANVLNRRQQASLISAYAALDQAFADYRTRVISFGGKEVDKAVTDAIEDEKRDVEENRPPWDEMQTFYLEGYPQFFEATMETVRTAEYVLNRNFVLKGEVSFNEFLRFLGLDDLGEKGENIGWEGYIGEAFYGYQWIDFDHIYRTTDDGMIVCEIRMPFLPHGLDDEDWNTEDSVPTCGVE